MVEHWSPKPGVGSSSLSSRANPIIMAEKGYIKESYNELMTKVSWPTWSELQNSAVVVMVASLIIALVVLLMDTVFSHAMQDIIYKILE